MKRKQPEVKPRIQTFPFLFTGILLATSALSETLAAETLGGQETNSKNSEIREQIETKKNEALLQLGYISISRSDKKITGLTPCVGFSHAVSSWLSLGGNLRFAFQPSSIVAIYTAFELKSIFAVTGSLIQNERSTFLDDKEVFHSRDFNSDGLRFEINASQFFFNSSASIVPLTGVGLSAYYVFASQSNIHFLLGVKDEILYGAVLSFSLIQGFAGITIGF